MATVAAPASPQLVARWHVHRQGMFRPVYFEPDQTLLVDEQPLDGLADDLRDLADSAQFRVVGHADSDEPNPQLVSSLRARSVIRGLVTRGVPSAALDLYAVGSSDPADLSRTESARARNRRVQIELSVPDAALE
jgi:outer membrane protein OmpA-like peptidoglycan-associated protein